METKITQKELLVDWVRAIKKHTEKLENFIYRMEGELEDDTVEYSEAEMIIMENIYKHLWRSTNRLDDAGWVKQTSIDKVRENTARSL